MDALQTPSEAPVMDADDGTHDGVINSEQRNENANEPVRQNNETEHGASPGITDEGIPAKTPKPMSNRVVSIYPKLYSYQLHTLCNLSKQ